MVEYKHIAISEETKKKLEKGMSRSDTWDSYLSNLSSSSLSPAVVEVGVAGGKHDCMKDKRVLAELDRLRSEIEKLSGPVNPDLMLKDSERGELESKIERLEGLLKKAHKDVEYLRLTKGNGVMKQSIDSLVAEFEEWAGNLMRRDKSWEKPLGAAVEKVNGWLK